MFDSKISFLLFFCVVTTIRRWYCNNDGKSKYLVLDVVLGIMIGCVLDLWAKDVRSCGVT